jgi:D-alanyl-D-alanine carboxypeptidase
MRLAYICIIGLFMTSEMAIGAQYKAALVADMDTGQVLYQENSNQLNYPASLTKIMTLYLTFDALEHGRLHLDDYLIVSQSAANASPVKLGLSAGSKIKVEDAIKALAVHSANDVARVLAENLKGGKEGNFASLMTNVATQIGLSRTNFENSSGLPDDDQLSTARDIALLSMAVYKHFPQYWKYFGIKSWSYNGKTYNNGNRLLESYPGCDGMKTGFTSKSKYSLVATAKRGNKRLMSVVLGASNKDVRAAVSIKMLDKGFSMVKIGAAPVVIQTATYDEDEEEFVTKTPAIVKKTWVAPGVKYGNSGVQFGAFASRSGAQSQQARIKGILGISTNIEPAPNGMFRVRANGLSDTAAGKLKSDAASAGIDSYIFH